MDFEGKDFLKLLDFSPDEIAALLDLAAELKARKKAGIPHKLCEGKNVALIFEKTSTRTRCAFEVAAYDLGMPPSISIRPARRSVRRSPSPTPRACWGACSTASSTAASGRSIVEELARYACVPVWNGLTNEFHPTQILADLLTIREHFGRLKGIKLVYMGDARYNMGNSLMVGCAKMGLHFIACAPVKFFPDAQVRTGAGDRRRDRRARHVLDRPHDRAADADVVYTDVWVSMGEPLEIWAERINAMLPYQVNAKAMSYAKPTAVFMHCLPAFHDLKTTIGKEVGRAVRARLARSHERGL